MEGARVLEKLAFSNAGLWVIILEDIVLGLLDKLSSSLDWLLTSTGGGWVETESDGDGASTEWNDSGVEENELS